MRVLDVTISNGITITTVSDGTIKIFEITNSQLDYFFGGSR